MAILNALDPLKTLIGLAEIVGLITAFAIASALLTPFIPGMLAFAGVIALLGAGIALLGAGLTVVTAGLTSFVVALPVIIRSLNSMLGSLIELLGHLAYAVVELLVSILDGIYNSLADHIPSMVDGMGRFFVGLFEGLGRWVPQITNALVMFVAKVIYGLGVALDNNSELIGAGIEKFMVGLFDLVWDALKGTLKGIWGILGDFWGDIANWGQKIGLRISNWFKGIKNSVEDESYEYGSNGGRGYAGGFKDGLESGADDAKDAAAAFNEDVFGVFKDSKKDAKDAGNAIGTEFTTAVSDSEKKGESKLTKFGSGLTTIIQNGVAKDVPNLGKFTGIGFIDNLVNSMSDDNSVKKVDEGLEKVKAHWVDKIEAMKLATDLIVDKMVNNFHGSVDEFNAIVKQLDSGTKMVNAASEIVKTQGYWALMNYDTVALAQRAGVSLTKLEEETTRVAVETEDATKKVDNLGGTAEKTSKHVQTLAEKLKSSLNIFQAFSAEASAPANELKKNLQSQFEGYSNWIDNLQNLMSRHIDKDVFKYLLDLGPSGAETVKEFVGKSDKWIKDYAKTLKGVNGLLTDSVFKPMEKYAETGKTTMTKVHESVDYLATRTDNTLAKIEARIKSFTQSFKELGDSMSLAITDSVSNTAKSIVNAAKDTDKALKNFKENLKNLKSRNASDEFIEYLVTNGEVDLARSLAWGSDAVLKNTEKAILHPKTEAYYKKMVSEIVNADYSKGVYDSTDSLAGKVSIVADANKLIQGSHNTTKFLEIFTRKYGGFINALGDTGAYEAAKKALYKFTKAEWDALESTEELKAAYKDGAISAQYYVEQKLQGMIEAYDAFTESIKDNISSQIDLFSSFNKQTQHAYEVTLDVLNQFDRKTDMTSEDILKNMRDNVEGAEEWARNLHILASSGLNEGLLAELTALGPAGYEKVIAFIEMTADQLAEANTLWGKSININLTDEVNKKLYPDYDASNMLGSMGSEVAAIKAWGDNINKLFATTLDRGIIQYLQDLGPAGADKVETFLKMTAAEMAEANYYWAEATQLSDDIGNEIAANWVAIGSYQVDGFIQGIEDKDAEIKQAGAQISDTAKSGFEEAAEIKDGKSEVASKEAQTVVDSIIDTLNDNKDDLKTAAKSLSSLIHDSLGEYLTEDNGKKLAKYIVSGLKDGLTNTKIVKPVLDAASSLSNSILEVARKILKINSPSKAFEEIGGYVCEGLAIGIEKNVNSAEESMEALTDNMIGMTYAALDAIYDDESFSPTITPVLDTTNIQNGVNWINGAFSNARIGLVASDFNESHITDITSIVSTAVDHALDKYTKTIEDALRNNATDVNVDISLEGDADGLFKAIRSKNEVYRKMTGRSALA